MQSIGDYKSISNFNVQAEMSVLGGLLLDPEKIKVVLPILKDDDFYNLYSRRKMYLSK